jgi:nanoRNase/pAp phosphatase (c-di-AMP/oligoRNAs hydrolase)
MLVKLTRFSPHHLKDCLRPIAVIDRDESSTGADAARYLRYFPLTWMTSQRERMMS